MTDDPALDLPAIDASESSDRADASTADTDTDRAQWLDRLVEAFLFEATGPLSDSDLAALATRGVGQAVTAFEVSASIKRLRRVLLERGSALDVFAWGGGWRLATTADLAPALDAARTPEAKPRALSAVLLETLAIVAYKQPVTRAEVEHVRGADSDYALARLVSLGLVDPVGRAEGVGRPLLYGTTDRFLDTFGLSALEDLPTLREVESLLADPAFSHERARLLAPALSDSASTADPGP